MEQRRLFDIGAKLVGLYFLVQAFPYLVGSITRAVVLIATTGQVLGRDKLYDTLALASDVLLVVISLFLLRAPHFVRWFAFEEQEDASTSRMQ